MPRPEGKRNQRQPIASIGAVVSCAKPLICSRSLCACKKKGRSDLHQLLQFQNQVHEQQSQSRHHSSQEFKIETMPCRREDQFKEFNDNPNPNQKSIFESKGKERKGSGHCILGRRVSSTRLWCCRALVRNFSLRRMNLLRRKLPPASHYTVYMNINSFAAIQERPTTCRHLTPTVAAGRCLTKYGNWHNNPAATVRIVMYKVRSMHQKHQRMNMNMNMNMHPRHIITVIRSIWRCLHYRRRRDKQTSPSCSISGLLGRWTNRIGGNAILSAYHQSSTVVAAAVVVATSHHITAHHSTAPTHPHSHTTA